MPDFLYIHIPFCIQKCIYCDFFSVPYEKSLVKSYIDALCKELYFKKSLSYTLKSIYIGGGTPSLLPDECFQQLFKCLKDNFNISPSVEITVEANPGTINESGIDTMLSLGVNRLSIGLQSYNDTELKTLGRIHTSDDSLRSLELIKKEGMINFSIDLMYGIPGQTMDSWQKSISKAVEFSPAHISAYELTPEENTRLYELIKSDKNHPPQSSPLAKGGFSDKLEMLDEDLILEMYNHVIDRLTNSGYEHYEISNFALPEFRCLHNLNYWNRGEYIGAGAGAHSFINNIRSKNIQNIQKYIKTLSSGIIPEIESLKIKPDEALKEFIFLGLRKTEGINISEIPHVGSTPSLVSGEREGGNNIINVSRELIDEGYIVIDNDNLKLTRKGIVISNAIIVRLFERLGL